jgi:hemerythrin-like domain-containing protein
MKNQLDDAFHSIAKPPMSALDDPIATCVAFHELVRKQCGNLETLAHDLARFRADNVARNRAAMIVRFFDVDAREHHADEESIFFPRLLALNIDAAEKIELAALLDVLSKDHRALHEIWQPLRQSLLNIVDGKTEWVDVDVATFVTLHHHHLHKEDSSVLPFARRHFSDEALQELRCAIVVHHSEIQH